ncbi:putative membrane protein [Chthoniobacter flavus]|nr:DUF1269 domain-containing protein [Chthoniobacter flavus]TCO85648.1 putative membrane protein [Chthoniobacter flavus]
MPNPYSLSTQKPPESGRFVVLSFPDESSAFALRDLLCDLEDEGVLEVGDAVIATRKANGKVRLHQSLPLVSARTLVGSFSGLVMGMMLLDPLFGTLAGAAAGVLSGVLGDVGIEDAFMKDLAATLQPGTSALFLIVHNTQREPLLERLRPFAGRCKVLQNTMTPENESALRHLLEGQLSKPAPPPSDAGAPTSQPTS